MLLNRTIYQLDVGPVPPERAKELAHLGYAQWLGALPSGAKYCDEVRRALIAAAPFCGGSPAVSVFCELLMASLSVRALDLDLPVRQRRGGARARRGAL